MAGGTAPRPAGGDSRPRKVVAAPKKKPSFPNKGDDGSSFVRDDGCDTVGRDWRTTG